MKKIKFNKQLPLTIQEANVIDIKVKNKDVEDNFIAVKKLQTNFVSTESFYKPISKMIVINGTK